MEFKAHQISLQSKDMLTCVNTILQGLNLSPVPTEEKIDRQSEIHFKIIDIEKQYDFTEIPKISIE